MSIDFWDKAIPFILMIIFFGGMVILALAGK
jgi:hypothetical protein